MNNIGSIGTAAIPLISSCLLMGAASSVMFESSDELALDAGQIVNGVLDDITTYLKIEDSMGKYYNTNGIRRVEKIVILIKPLIKSSINISAMTIKLQNNNDVTICRYSGHSDEINAEPIFENQVWDKTNNSFSFIVIIDEDRSLLEHNIMNEDTAFIAIKLPERFTMNDKESIIVSIIPAKGITRSVVLETPSFHTANIISFGKV